MIGRHSQFFDCCITDSTSRIIDNPNQGFFIFWIDNQSQITQNILDFFSLVKRQTSINSIWNIAFSQCILHCSRLCIGSIQNGKLTIEHLVLHLLFKNGASHETSFLCICQTAVHFYFGTIGIGSPNNFVEFGFVFIYNRISGFDNVFRRTVILFQSKGFHALIILLEIQYVVDIGTPKSINTLRIITHNAYILEFIRQSTDYQIL